MSLRALKVLGPPHTARARQVVLDPGTGAAFLTFLSQEQPAVFIAASNDLDTFRKLDDVIVDRGNKHRATQLSKLLLGQVKIPLIDGGYRSTGQLIRSVRTLLGNAVELGDRNTYIIGSAAKMFDELWSKAARAGDDGSRAAGSVEESSNNGSTKQLLDSLPYEPIDDGLRRRYVGDAPEVELVRQFILKFARRKEPVLILGPTGSGKEVVARALHDYGSNKTEPFKAINCGAITSTLFEAELFGYKKGAFTGALRDTVGLWKAAGHGTLLLDEVGDLPLDQQVKILRALQEHKIRPVGATEDVPVHARVIAATNRDLAAMIRSGQFRQDLYYRLLSLLIYTPALHEHPQDIALVANHLWQKVTGKPGAKLSQPVLTELESYRWPGNVREMKIVLLRLFALFETTDPTVKQLRMVFDYQGQIQPGTDGGIAAERSVNQHRVECMQHLRRVSEVLRACEVTIEPMVRDNRTDAEAAESVRGTLHYRLHELDLLCSRPLLLHSDATFEAVDALKTKLVRLYTLLDTDPKAALRFWKKEVVGEFKQALAAIFKEAERVMQGA